MTLNHCASQTYERQIEHLTYVRLLIREHRAEEALVFLGHVQDAARSAGRHGDLVEMYVLEALAYKASGNTSLAVDALNGALNQGAPGGYLQTFLNEGNELGSLLRVAATRGVHREYAQRILDAMNGTSAFDHPTNPVRWKR